MSPRPNLNVRCVRAEYISTARLSTMKHCLSLSTATRSPPLLDQVLGSLFESRPVAKTVTQLTICVPGQFSKDQGLKWYVQPGGMGGRKEWSEEDWRVIWEVPQAIIFDKVGTRCSDLPRCVSDRIYGMVTGVAIIACTHESTCLRVFISRPND